MKLARASTSEIIGLLEILNDYKGDEDLAKLADDFDLEIDEILPSADAAELLGFVEISKGNLKLTDTGRKMLEGNILKRKEIFREQLLKTKFFKELIEKIKSKNGRMSREEAFEFISSRIKTHNIREYFRVVIGWGRYAEVIGYEHDKAEIYLMNG